MKRSIFLILLMILAFSCQNKTNSTKEQKLEKDENVIEKVESSSGIVFSDTTYLDFNKYSMLLTVLVDIPDSSMKSWGWPKSERMKILRSVQENGYFIDSTPDFNNILEIKPNKLKTQVVDGTWVLVVYKTQKGELIIITNDIVGGGNEIMVFKKSKSLTALQFEELIPQFPEIFMTNSETSCYEELKESNLFALADYDFENKGVRISLNYVDDYEDCLKDTSLYFEFKPDKGIFEQDSSN